MFSLNDIGKNKVSPICIRIPGEFWDSQSYSGDLWLFYRDGSLGVLGWQELIEKLRIPQELRCLTEDLLLQNDRLYEGAFHRYLQHDPEFRQLFQTKIERIRRELNAFEIREQRISTFRRRDNPLPFPHNDSEIYYGKLYVGASTGVFRLNSEDRYGRGKKSEKISGAPALGIAGKYATMAIAAGDEGLIQTDLGRGKFEQDNRPLKRPCMTCEWSGANLICNDDTNSLYVAEYSTSLQPESRESGSGRRHTVRQFEGILGSKELFDSKAGAICWGAAGRLFAYGSEKIRIVKNEFRKTRQAHPGTRDRFTRLGDRDLRVEGNPEQFVTAKAAPFGSVLEFDDRLVVLSSSGEQLTLEGEPVNWRVFPQSHHYLSHLHVVWEDRLDIFVFVHDYFLPESERLYGTDAFEDGTGMDARGGEAGHRWDMH